MKRKCRLSKQLFFYRRVEFSNDPVFKRLNVKMRQIQGPIYHLCFLLQLEMPGFSGQF